MAETNPDPAADSTRSIGQIIKTQRKRCGEILAYGEAKALEVTTGILSSDRKELTLSAGRMLLAMRGGKFLDQLSSEFKHYCDKTRIKPDYGATEQCQSCLHELLDYLDKEIPDEATFSVLKKIFLVAATEEASDRASVLPQQYMRICRRLSSGEVLVLLANWEALKENDATRPKPGGGTKEWLEHTAEHSGLEYPELVEIHEQKLIAAQLLTGRTHTDGSGVIIREKYRLTDLGYAICEFIDKYDEPTEKT